MRGVFALVLLLGVGLAGGAAKMVMDHIELLTQQRDIAISRIAPAVPMAEVLLLTKELRSGEALTQEHVAVTPWPQAHVPKESFTNLETLFPTDAAGPRVALMPMIPGEVILATKLSKPGAPVGLAFQLEPGKTALALRVDVASGVSGFLQPGDRVDVVWTGNPPDGSGEITRLIQSSVKLVAIDQTRNEDRNRASVARTVTVEVTRDEGVRLTQAQVTGRLTLFLVGAADENSVESVIEVDQRGLLGIEAEAAPQAVEQQRICTVRKRQGAQVFVEEIPCTN